MTVPEPERAVFGVDRGTAESRRPVDSGKDTELVQPPRLADGFSILGNHAHPGADFVRLRWVSGGFSKGSGKSLQCVACRSQGRLRIGVPGVKACRDPRRHQALNLSQVAA
jgi:hypothetical protein